MAGWAMHIALMQVLLLVHVSIQCPTECDCSTKGYVRCSGVSSVPTGIPVDTHTLNLDRNNLYTLPTDAFKGLKSLKVIEIQESNVTIVEPFAFRGLKNVHTIILSKNNIGCLDANAMGGMEDIAYLHLNNNQIKTIAAYSFNNTKNIGSLQLHSNPIIDIEKHAFDGLTGIKVLDLTRLSEITTLGTHIFHGLVQVSEIRFSYSKKLRAIEKEAFHGIQSADIIKLDNCAIDFIEQNAFQDLNGNVNKIHLESNQISYLGDGALAGVETVNIDFSDNPLVCDCNLKWILSDKLHNMTKKSMVCKYPSTVKDKPISHLRETHLKCLQCSKLPTSIENMPKSNSSYKINCIMPSEKPTKGPETQSHSSHISYSIMWLASLVVMSRVFLSISGQSK